MYVFHSYHCCTTSQVRIRLLMLSTSSLGDTAVPGPVATLIVFEPSIEMEMHFKAALRQQETPDTIAHSTNHIPPRTPAPSYSPQSQVHQAQGIKWTQRPIKQPNQNVPKKSVPFELPAERHNINIHLLMLTASFFQ